MTRSPEILHPWAKRREGKHRIANGIALGLIANKIGGEIVWGGERRSELRPLPYEGPRTIASGIVFPGMGNSGNGSRRMAEQLQKALPNQPWAYIQYDNSRELKTDDIAHQLTKYLEKTRSEYLDIYASSMGFTVAIKAAAKAGIPIRIIFANSSPSDIQDGYGSKAGVIAAKLPNTELIGKFTGTFAADTIRPGGEDVISNLWHAFRETFTGGSPKLFKSQVKILQSVNLEKNWDEYKGIIDPAHTVAMYASPSEENDNTVRVGQAYEGLQTFFNRLLVPLERLEMPFAHHADTEAAVRIGQAWLREQDSKSKEYLIFSNKDHQR